MHNENNNTYNANSNVWNFVITKKEEKVLISDSLNLSKDVFVPPSARSKALLKLHQHWRFNCFVEFRERDGE